MLARFLIVAAVLMAVASVQLIPQRLTGDARGCQGPAARGAAPSSGPAGGRGLAVLDGSRLIMLSENGGRTASVAPTRGGIPRHIASGPGVGTAYVNDLRGPDVVMVLRRSGVTTIEGRGELTHPAWSSTGDLAWSVNLSALELWSPGRRAPRTVRPPRAASAVFSPVFIAPGDLVAIVGEPVGDVHDDALDNLWRYDIGRRTWSRLTRFRADADRWSVLRTPLVLHEGTVLFVRVRGRATATEHPSFALWRFEEGRAAKVRDLPGEMYLAGSLGGRLVWNVPDAATGEWRLVAEGPVGRMDLGCGAVAVDPIGEPDPDLLEPEDPGSAGGGSVGPTAPGDPGKGLALVIGDFASESDALALQTGLRITEAVAVDHSAAPAAVRPGAWAVAVPIPDDTRPEEALERFRARHPDLADLIWIVPFAPREVAP